MQAINCQDKPFLFVKSFFIIQDYCISILSVSNIYRHRYNIQTQSKVLHCKGLTSTRLTKSVTFPKNGEVHPPTVKRLFHPRSKAKNASNGKSPPIGPHQEAGPGSVTDWLQGLKQQSISRVRGQSQQQLMMMHLKKHHCEGQSQHKILFLKIEQHHFQTAWI